jgi:hypothetical protein
MSKAFKKLPSKSVNGRTIHLVRGDPDCAAFYQWIHSELTTILKKNWPPKITALTTGLRGNLGEFISYRVARASGLYGKKNGFTIALMGALTPLQHGAPPGLDITIVYLDPGGDVNKDCLYIMEVKTTGNLTLTYATALVGDYKKLLGKATIAGSLGERMNWLQAYLSETHEFSEDDVERVGNLFMPAPKDCTRIKLLPTLVHDRNAGDAAAIAALDNVSKKIEGLGWRKSAITPWSIAMKKLTKCLIHLSNDGSTMP